MDNFILISGCSGGGKSTLLAALGARGHHVVTDAARRDGLTEAKVEYDRLLTACPALGYRIALLPKAPVGARADFLLSALRGFGPES